METTKPTVLKVVQIITDKLALDQNRLSYKASFSDDLGVDSLDVYELLATIEKEFKINIDNEDAEKLTTVGALIDYIDDKVTHHAKQHQVDFFTLHSPNEGTSTQVFFPIPDFK